MSKILSGGCLCGGLRYEVNGGNLKSNHCHCLQCRRSCGGVFMTWFMVPSSNFSMTQGAVKEFNSMPTSSRGFFADCGCQITFRYHDNDQEIFVSAASLDNPEIIKPSGHSYIEESVLWLHIDDGLPQNSGDPAEGWT